MAHYKVILAYDGTHFLGFLHLIAEGVERTSHRDALRRLGCNSMQGFLFSAALPGEELTRYLNRSRDGSALQ